MLASEYGTVGFQQHKYACSTMSSETLSESCGSRNNRIRTIRLVRPCHGPLPPPGVNYRHGPSLGFSIRGGREHGTGIFVSYVEVGSEASLQGLRVGDQIIRVNGFAVDDAVHKEVLQLISNHTHLTLKVRGVGMIPVKDKKTDALSWQIITECGSSPTRGSPQLGEKLNDVRINIVVAPKSKLGCGISKGPDWKPGIFVQFSKEGGIARDAGLRPGDQILYCNNVDFSDINFNEAVNLMKSSRQLNLLVRKGAGLDLFPGESSGYNSSASSVTEDQSPPWSDSKRLSIVKEENLDLGERLNHLDKFKNLINTSKKWDTWDEEPEEKPLFKPTIINLTENGTTIHNNGSIEPIIEEYSSTSSHSYNSYRKSCTIQDQETLENIYAVPQKQPETKTVVVDVHRSDVDASRHDNGHLALMKSPSSSSFCSIASKSSCTSSVTSNMTTSSLSSAITMELQRRQKKALTEKPSIEEQLQMKRILKNVDDDKQHQHSKLMDEFKKAHQRMFKNNEPSDDDTSKSSTTENDERLKNNKNSELSRKLAERLSDLHVQNGASDETKPMTLNAKSNPQGPMPPPPPPPPQFNGTTTTAGSSASSSTPSSPTSSTRSNTLKKPKAPPVPVKYSILSYKTANNSPNPPSSVKNQSFNQPPPCPTPDYDTLSLASSYGNGLTSKSSLNRTKNDDSAEMQSIDSFKINNSTSEVQPRPPSTYFQKRTVAASLSNQSSKTSTIRKSRPISVTIGEYPSMRRQPGRLDFLQNGTEVIDGQSIGNRLTSELTQTLNRSNLKKKTESMANPDKG